MNDPPLPRPSLVTALEERLRSDLEAERYRPGDLLPPERDLATQYGVARATVKQALARLEQLGLIETRHGVGSRVRSPDEGAGSSVLRWLVGLGEPRWIDDLFEARRLFGPVVARQAAAHASAQHRERLQTLLGELEAAESAEQVHAFENEIHRVLAQAANNRVLRLLVDGMIKGYAPVRSLLHRVFADAGAIAEGLGPIVRAVSAGKQLEAERAAQRYFDWTGPRLRAALKKRK